MGGSGAVRSRRPLRRQPAKVSAAKAGREFEDGSGIDIPKLDTNQISNLVTLGKVWGFLKYYDPAVTSGKKPWDDELFRVLPAVLAAHTRAAANAAILHWIDGLGPVKPCDPCAPDSDAGLQLSANTAWIRDSGSLGAALSRKLEKIRINRSVGPQYYVTLKPEVGNPVFRHESSYLFASIPNAALQLLALYRFWNIIEYWYPYRNVTGEDWDEVLASFIPRLALARSRADYQRQLMMLIAKVHDTHANLWGSPGPQPPTGSCRLPIYLRFVQDQAVVTGYMDGAGPDTTHLQVGDVVTGLDGEAVAALVNRWAPYYGASNQAARLRNIAAYMTRGRCGAVRVSIHRNDRSLKLTVKRVPIPPGGAPAAYHDLPGPAFRLLDPQVAYLKLSTADASKAAQYIQRAQGSKGLIIDARNYPATFLPFALGALLVDRKTPFARFTKGTLSDPGAFHWTKPVWLEPKQPHYSGKVVILVDAVTQSAAEYTVMALRTAPGAVVIGSTTAGADGNVSRIPLPGDLYVWISGIGVFYPDRKPTQRVGIVPDIVVEPTISDIRKGVDPVLEAALRVIFGSKARHHESVLFRGEFPSNP